MIEGIFKTANTENAPTKEVQRRNYLNAGKLRPEDPADTEEAAAAKKAEEAGAGDLKDAIKRIESTANYYNRQLKIELEKDLNITVVKIVDGETKEVIRQIPPEEIVELSKHAQDLKGLLIHKEV